MAYLTAGLEEKYQSIQSIKRRFKSATGYSALDYVQTLRIEEAKQMLEASDDAVDTIAYSIGYEDRSSFRKLFKKHTGTTPAHYRRRFQNLATHASANIPMSAEIL